MPLSLFFTLVSLYRFQKLITWVDIIIKGDIKMHGMKKLTVFSRRVLSKSASQLDLSAPTLTKTSKTQQYGDDGHGGKQGVPGPQGKKKWWVTGFSFKKNLAQVTSALSMRRYYRSTIKSSTTRRIYFIRELYISAIKKSRTIFKR